MCMQAIDTKEMANSISQCMGKHVHGHANTYSYIAYFVFCVMFVGKSYLAIYYGNNMHMHNYRVSHLLRMV